MAFKIIPFVIALGLFSTCDNNPTDNAASEIVLHDTVEQLDEKHEQIILFHRLLGVWKNEDGKSYERWTKNADGSYNSVGFQLKDKDTVFTERVYVHLENDQWVSENTVPDQNNGNAIKFKVTSLSENEAHFNNPTHDFPTDIHYSLSGNDTIQVYIAGPNQIGSFDTIPFNFIRIAN